MRTFVSVILVAIVALLISNNQPASATIITVEVEGVVDSIGTYFGFDLDGSVSIGTPMSGFCTYDTDTPDYLDSDDSRGAYPLISISMTIGNYTFTHNPMSSKWSSFYVRTYSAISGSAVYSAGSPESRFEGTITVNGIPKSYDDLSWYISQFVIMELSTSSSEQIPTDALPDLDSWPDISVFDLERKFLAVFGKEPGDNTGSFEIGGEVTSATVIPEPATLLLLGLGSLALLTKRRA